MSKNRVQTDVVIVGGGMAGLTAANYLARSGMAVTLFEKASGLGGRAATQEFDGYHFNRGIHAFYTGGAGSEVLQELGITYRHGTPGKISVLYQGEMHTYPYDALSLLSSRLLDMSDKLEFARLFSTLPRINARELGRISVQDWLEQNCQRVVVRRLMSALAQPFVYSSALDLVSAEVLVKKFQLLLKHPVHYIDGGWKTLVEALRHKAEGAGAQIMSGVRVEAVEYADGRVQGVRLRDGKIVQARVVILALPPQDALKLIDEGRYAPLKQIVEGIIPARVACLDVALRHLPNARYPIALDLEQPRFMSTQSIYARIAPDGGALIHAFKQLDPRQPFDARKDERDLEEFLDVIQPGWHDQVVKRIFLPHMEAIGMLPTVEHDGYAGRPQPQVPGISNLYLAGDWIGEGFLIDASMGSARQVARLLVPEKQLVH